MAKKNQPQKVSEESVKSEKPEKVIEEVVKLRIRLNRPIVSL
jgi:hypothetical protein